MRLPKIVAIVVITSILHLAPGKTATAAELKCIDSKGAAAIINNDMPSAKLEAVARARWAAVETVVGVEVRAQSLVQNSLLLDDMVSTQVKGYISSYKTLDEKRDGDIYNITVNACVEPAIAAEAISSLALNRSVAVFVPARKPKVHTEVESTTVVSKEGSKTTKRKSHTTDEQDETNIFSESLIDKLVDQGFTVTDVAATQAMDAESVEKAMKSGNFLTMRSLIYKFLSNVILIGKVDYNVTQNKGEDIGYDVEMPYNRVTVRLTYRLMSRSQETNQFVILGAGTAEAHGNAASLEDATAKGLQSLSDKVIPTLLDKFARHIKGSTRKITVKVDGLQNVEKTIDLKSTLGGITWVTGVEAVGLDEFVVSYPENSLYLANSLSRNPHLKVDKYEPYMIKISYRK